MLLMIPEGNKPIQCPSVTSPVHDTRNLAPISANGGSTVSVINVLPSAITYLTT